jgi:uncharacterized membrane-anchored protein YitT (DUF2179 family)
MHHISQGRIILPSDVFRIIKSIDVNAFITATCVIDVCGKGFEELNR